MAKIIGIILLCAFIAASTTAQRQVAVGEYPAQVQLVITPGARVGDGVILNINHVLTVAQNVFHHVELNTRLAPADIAVRAGLVLIPAQAPPATLPIQRIFAHHNYNFHTRKFDVAVLRMTNNFVFTPDLPTPNIAPVTFNNRIIPEGNFCQFVGFGPFAAANPNTALLETTLSVQHRGQCNGVDNPLIRGNVYDQHICIGLNTPANPAICNNNAGAAMYCAGRFAGLRVLGRQCNALNSPAIMLQSRWFQEWIPQQFTRNDNPAAGPVGPPGTPPGDGAATIILSTVAIVCGLLFNMVAL